MPRVHLHHARCSSVYYPVSRSRIVPLYRVLTVGYSFFLCTYSIFYLPPILFWTFDLIRVASTFTAHLVVRPFVYFTKQAFTLSTRSGLRSRVSASHDL